MKSTIQDMLRKIKGLEFSLRTLPKIPDDVFLGAVIVLVAFGSFGLGRLSKIEGAKTPIRIENAPEITPETFSNGATKENNIEFTTSKEGMSLVGSKNGTKYHYTWCAGAQRITEANRIYFTSKEDATARGYTPASNCKGL